MEVPVLLQKLFPKGHDITFDGSFFSGQARVAQRSVMVTGVQHQGAIGVELAHRLAGATLESVRNYPGQPILLVIDTSGQRLSRRDELLGLNGYMAHLAKCLDFARRNGCRTVALVCNEAVSGGFLATSLQADSCYALPEAQIRVMNLPAMARVTRIPLERLQALSRISPVFAPGADMFFRMGAIREIWNGDLTAHLIEALAQPVEPDRRRADGEARGGRTLAMKIATRVRRAAF